MLHQILVWLDTHVRKRLEGTVFDRWIASPAKTAYVKLRRLD